MWQEFGFNRIEFDNIVKIGDKQDKKREQQKRGEFAGEAILDSGFAMGAVAHKGDKAKQRQSHDKGGKCPVRIKAVQLNHHSIIHLKKSRSQ
jgi:hypothetical protein